ncbi:MAG: hypothetical protein HYY52_02175 [Candidatus Melainabacteria bacterium]|nr:hypothetical protein [Candidatus Melainabacteria bacterium]
MTRRAKLLTHEDSWWIKNYPDALDYVKMVLDSESAPAKDFERTPGRTLLTGEYKILKRNNDEFNMKRIAEAVVKLLDDPDYACDAIPVAAELGIPEAKEWFLELSKKSVEEIRKIKTNDFINAYFCLLNFTWKVRGSFLDIIKNKVQNNSLNKAEYFRAIDIITEFDPLWIESELAEHIIKAIDVSGRDNDESYALSVIICRYLEKRGYNKIVEVTKSLKNSNLFIKKLLKNFIDKYVLTKPEYKKFGEIALEELSK